MSNDVLQGRILSPSFFNLHMDELSVKLSIGETKTGHYTCTTQMLAWNIDTYTVINCKLAFVFRKRVLLYDHFIVQTIVS